MARVNWAVAAVALGLTTSAGAANEPTVLSDLELDAITAAGVLVDVSSIAAAVGDFASAKTDANTFAFDGQYLDLGIGITMGHALACCGEEADVEVGSAVLGIGDSVRGTTHTVEHDGRRWKHAFSIGFVVAASFAKHFVAVRDEHLAATVRDEHLAMLEQLRAALADFHFELLDAVKGPDLWSSLVTRTGSQ